MRQGGQTGSLRRVSSSVFFFRHFFLLTITYRSFKSRGHQVFLNFSLLTSLSQLQVIAVRLLNTVLPINLPVFRQSQLGSHYCSFQPGLFILTGCWSSRRLYLCQPQYGSGLCLTLRSYSWKQSRKWWAGNKSGLAHRMMLIGLLRILGAVKRLWHFRHLLGLSVFFFFPFFFFLSLTSLFRH